MKNIKKVLIVSKMTELEFDELRYGNAVDDYYKKNKIDVKSLEENHHHHYQNLEKIVKLFESHHLNPGLIKKQSLSSRDFKEGWDLVVSVGGDGTVLDTARYVFGNTLFLPVKSSPRSRGGHCTSSFDKAEEHIKQLFEGNYRIEERARLKGIIENEFTITDFALNEVFVGDIYSPGYAKLDIFLDDKLYNSGSSGIIVSTFTGQTGWYNQVNIIEKDPRIIEPAKKALREAGLDDQIQMICRAAEFKPGEENIIRYKVRESRDMGENYGFDYGILQPGQELKITSKILIDGAVAFDGNKPTKPRHRVYNLPYGTSIKISISDQPLYVINFD